MTAKNDLVSRARASLEADDPERALAVLEAAAARDSSDPAVLLVLAEALGAHRRIEDARALLEGAAARLQSAGLFIRAAGLAMEQGDRSARDRLLSAAVALDPDSIATRAALGDAAADDGDPEQAILAYEQALSLVEPKARPVTLLFSLATELRKVCRDREAVAHIERADRGAATDPTAHSSLLMHSHYVSPDALADADGVRAALEQNAASHRRFGRRFGAVYRVATRSVPAKRPRLRVGYLSADLNNHSVARFFMPMVLAHDAARFEVILYSTTLGRHDDVTRALSARARLVDLREASTAAIVSAVAADALDVLVDLGGHTSPHQLPAIARRLAPLQLTFLGYPDVTGLPAMDGFITDRVASPEAADAYTVEPLVRLPHTAWTFEGLPDGVDRARVPSDHVALGALHNLSKLSDSMLGLWGRILARVPDARLVLSTRSKTEHARASLEQRLAARGLPTERVDILPAIASRSGHLDRLRRLDLMLDTFPYAGTTTTSEALSMGVPVVTLAGATHASRVGASLLAEVGLADLVAATPEEYVEKAVALALDAGRRAALRATLPDTLRATVLGDATRFTRSLEALYERELAAKMSEPGAALVRDGSARVVTALGHRLLLPGELADPHSFRIVEQERIDDGELEHALCALPASSSVVDVLPNPGLSTWRITSHGHRAHVVEPLPSPTFAVTLAQLPAASWERVDVLPGGESGQVPIGGTFVRTAPLDDRIQGDVALIRIGAPGLELPALAGARRLLSGGALVLLDRMFAPIAPLEPALASLGLTAMGLVPLLGVVASLGAPQAKGTPLWDELRASVFVVSKAARARFGASLAIVDEAAVSGDAPVRAEERTQLRGAAAASLPPGLAALLAAKNPELPLPTRLGWLRRAALLTAQDVRERPEHVGRRFTHARALFELGARGAIGPVLEPLLDRIDSFALEHDEPLIALLPRFELPEPASVPWAKAQCIEAFVKYSAPSSFFHPESFLSLFARFDELGFPDPEMERRECLLRTRFERRGA